MEKPSHGQRLTSLREKAGLSIRELARQIGLNHSTLVFWEKNDRLPRSEVLLPLAKALGVSVEEILGGKSAKSGYSKASKVGQVFSSVSELPRRQQQKIAEVVEGMLLLQEAKGN